MVTGSKQTNQTMNWDSCLTLTLLFSMKMIFFCKFVARHGVIKIGIFLYYDIQRIIMLCYKLWVSFGFGQRRLIWLPGGHSHWKGVWGCAAVTTPFFQTSHRSLAYQFTVNAPLLCPLFSIFRKFLHFQPCFGQNSSALDPNFSKFCS